MPEHLIEATSASTSTAGRVPLPDFDVFRAINWSTIDTLRRIADDEGRA